MLNLIIDGFTRKGDILCGFNSDDNSISETNKTLLKDAFENYKKADEFVEKIASLGESAQSSKLKKESLEPRILLLRSKLVE